MNNQTLTKEQVQQRVLKDGKPLDIDKFTWDQDTRTFSSYEDDLVFDFSEIDNCNFNVTEWCIFKTGWDCTFYTKWHCKFITGSNCTFNTGSHSIFYTGDNCIFSTESYCTFNTLSDCIFRTGSHCTFETEDNCIFNTVSCCIFNTENSCTFNTVSDCTFKTFARCTFNTDSNCTFDIYENGYFNTTQCDNNVVIIRSDNAKKIIDLSDLQNNKLVLISYDNDPIYRDIKDIKFVDYCTMIINSIKQLVQYKIHSACYIDDYFYRDNPPKVFIAEQDNLYAHGKSIKKAIEDLEFKKLSQLGANEHIKRIIKQGYMSAQDYRLLTGACREGTNRFLEDNDLGWNDSKSIKEVIKLTKDSYGYNVFIRLLKENGYKIK